MRPESIDRRAVGVLRVRIRIRSRACACVVHEGDALADRDRHRAGLTAPLVPIVIVAPLGPGPPPEASSAGPLSELSPQAVNSARPSAAATYLNLCEFMLSVVSLRMCQKNFLEMLKPMNQSLLGCPPRASCASVVPSPLEKFS